MKKNTKRLCIGALAVIILGSVYAWLTLHPADTSTDTQTAQLVSFNRDDITDIQISLRDGSNYALHIESADSGTAYIMSGGEADLDYSETLMQSLRDAAYSISARPVEENCSDLETYGLSENSQTDTITITDSNGTKAALTIGLSNDFGTYCTLDRSNIYLLDNDDADMLTQPQSYYRNLTILGGYYSLSEELKTLSIDHLSDGTVLSVEARDISALDSDAVSAYSNFIFTSPISCDADNSAFTNGVLSGLQSGLTAQRIAEDNPSNISQYGFNTRISLTANNLDAVILIGNVTEDNEIYVMLEGGSTVFACDASDYAFLQDDWNNWRSTNLMPCALCEIDRITVNNHTVEITHIDADENEEQDTDTETALLDGNEITHDELQQIFLAVSSVHYTRLIDNPRDAQAEISVTLVMSDGTTRSLAFIKGGSREYLANVNGNGYAYGVPQDDVTSILEAAEKAL